MRPLASILVIQLFVLNSCGGGGSGLQTASSLSPNAAISSPLASTSGSSVIDINRSFQIGASHEERKAALEDLRDATSVAGCNFNVDFTSETGGRVSCYGPEVTVGGTHPTTGQPVQKNDLPGGDLGIWNSTDRESDEACAAAQLNALFDGHTKIAFFAQLVGFATFCFAKNSSGITLPSSEGASIRFTSDQLSAFGFGSSGSGSDEFSPSMVEITRIKDSDNNAGYRYEVKGQASDGSGGSKEFHIYFQHAKLSGGGSNGSMAFALEDASNTSFNCNAEGGSGSTYAGDMVYEENASGIINLEFRTARFCGLREEGESPIDSENFRIDACDRMNEDNPDGWGDDFNYGLFSYNSRTLEGNYSYVWQAGTNDPNGRVFNVVIDDDDTGRGYFGFGEKVTTGEGEACQANNLGEITGMVCNWVGDGGHLVDPIVSLPALVQRQSMQKNDQGLWILTGEAIKYSPTRSCDGPPDGSYTYNTDAGDFSNDSNEVLGSGDVLDLESLANYQADYSLPTAPTF